MADYKELLRRAVEALPENNGAARRAVYEKARAALVGQLRAINPPLAARDITTHRLQLEDCIRQVEQEASEAVIAGMTNGHDPVPPPPVYFEPPTVTKQLAGPSRGSAKPQLSSEAPLEKSKATGKTASIEEIIAAADRDAREQPPAVRGREEVRPEARAESKSLARPIQLRSVPRDPEPEVELEDEASDAEPVTQPTRPGGRPVPAIVARAEAAKSRSGNVAFGMPAEKPYDSGRRGPTLEARRDGAATRPDASRAPKLSARTRPEAEYSEAPQRIAAMSAVREVEVEADLEPAGDPQDLIDRAMATLDREARGDEAPAHARVIRLDEGQEDNDDVAPIPVRNGLIGGLIDESRPQPAKSNSLAKLKGRLSRPAEVEADEEIDEPAPLPRPKARTKPEARKASKPVGGGREVAFPRARAEDERSGVSAVTIFLIVFTVLLMGAGGAGVWAWNEGYLDLDSVFSNQNSQDVVASANAPALTDGNIGETAVPQSGPGNTTLADTTPASVPELSQDDRLPTEPVAVPSTPALAIAEPVPTDSQQRLTPGSAAAAIGDATGDVAALNPEGSQSLLLEASDDGRTGALPFSGTIEWSQGKDETGLPTIIGKASIPARNLGVDLLIRKNVDATLPASHLMEVNFRVSDSFIGGSVAGLPGVLLKNEELVQGQPLVGASARVVGNSFLFALSAAPEDQKANSDLLMSRKWMDLALIYATGKRAIITLEKDASAEKLFGDVVTAWNSTASAQ